MTLLTVPGTNNVTQEDLVLGYQIVAFNGDHYLVYVNADSKSRQFDLSKITNGLSYLVLADGNQVDLAGISELSGVTINNHILTLDPLTATIIRLTNAKTPTDQVANPSEKTGSFGGKDTEVTKAMSRLQVKRTLLEMQNLLIVTMVRLKLKLVIKLISNCHLLVKIQIVDSF